MADQQAKEATSLGTPPGRPVSLASAISCIKQAIQDPAIQHKRTAAVYSKHREARDRQEITTRKDVTLLAQLRSRHTAFCSKHTDICWTNQPTPPAQDAERHLIHWSTGWIAPTLYMLGVSVQIGRNGKAYFVTSLVTTPLSSAAVVSILQTT